MSNEAIRLGDLPEPRWPARHRGFAKEGTQDQSHPELARRVLENPEGLVG
jgi:hypothetical protein